jgi:hypothetical protein
MSKNWMFLEALGGRADDDQMIKSVNELQSAGLIEGELQEGLVFSILGRRDAEAKIKKVVAWMDSQSGPTGSDYDELRDIILT